MKIETFSGGFMGYLKPSRDGCGWPRHLSVYDVGVLDIPAWIETPKHGHCIDGRDLLVN